MQREMSGSGGSSSSSRPNADVKFNDALIPTRSLMFYTVSAAGPVFVIVAALLFLRPNKHILVALSLLGALVSATALARLLYDLTMDIAGYPDFKLPVWAVFYLIIYVVLFFMFAFFGLHVGSPGVYFGGIDDAALLDSLYMSLCNYIGVSPDPSITLKTQLPRFLSVIQGFISMFINVVIITKFVNTF
jgi:hypothetical protein